MATQQERRAATQHALVTAGRDLFARDGFDAVPAEAVVAAAGVTRGALYHHYDGKEGLFLAVVDLVMGEVAARLAAAAAGASGPREAVLAGLDAFLDVALDPGVRQVLFVDAPHVLGWTRWRAMDEQHGLGLLTAAVAAVRPPVPSPAVTARLVMGLLIEAAMLVAADPATRDAVRATTAAAITACLVGPTGGAS